MKLNNMEKNNIKQNPFEKNLKDSMQRLYDELINSENNSNYKVIIAKAVNLGMSYEKSKLQQEIYNIFSNHERT